MTQEEVEEEEEEEASHGQGETSRKETLEARRLGQGATSVSLPLGVKALQEVLGLHT